MRPLYKVLITIAVLIIAGGLFIITYYPKLAQNILIPDIKQMESAQLRLKGDTIFARISLLMANHGIFKMNLDSISYKVEFDTMRVLSKTQDLSIVLRPGESDTFMLPVAIPFRRIAARIGDLQDRDSVDIHNDIRLVYRTVFGRAVLPHKKTSRIVTPIPPQFSVERVEFVSRKGKTLQLLAHLKFVNKGRLMLQIKDLKYSITVMDLFVAEGKVDRIIEVIPRNTIIEKVPVTVDLKRPLKTAYLVASNQDLVPYSLQISLVVTAGEVMNETKVSLENRGKFELRK